MSTLTELFTNIANAIRSKTGGTASIKAEDFPSAINGISVGVEGGIIPTGTKSITANGTYDVKSYANAEVNVPDKGITPSGTKSITANGTHDVTAFANAAVQVEGLNAKVFTVSISADKTSGQHKFLTANEYMKTLRSNSKAFVMVRPLSIPASTAMFSWWLTTNFTLFYNGATAYNSMVARTTASNTSVMFNVNGLPGDNYSGHLNINTSGDLYIDCNSTYPLKAGQYQIIAGTVEML